jgi:hypothetical protein
LVRAVEAKEEAQEPALVEEGEAPDLALKGVLVRLAVSVQMEVSAQLKDRDSRVFPINSINP